MEVPAMTRESRILAGVVLITYPTVIPGGVSRLSMLLFTQQYAANPLRQDLWRAGHAHAGVLLVLAVGLFALGVGLVRRPR
jgi:hypothetical protein